MKTSRLALGANPCGATHPCASASTRPAKSGRNFSHFAAIICLALIGQTANAASVKLAWNPNPETNIASYKLSYGTSPGSYSNTISTGTVSNSTVSGLSEGQTYYFVVKAVNTAGLESVPSTELSYQVPLPPNTAPLADSQNVITDKYTSVAITLAASDADGDALSYTIINAPSLGTLSGTAPNLTYTPSGSGTDQFQFAVSDGTYTSNTGTVSITISEQPIELTSQILDRSLTTIHSVSSEETNGENGRAVNAIDGISTTYWCSKWSILPPHYIALDLGTSRQISGMRYSPTKDGDPAGNITRYEIHTSTDGTNWTLRASGTWTANGSDRDVAFSPVTGRYIKLTSTADRYGCASEVQAFCMLPNQQLNSQILDRTLTTIHSVSSEETIAENGRTANAIDGNSGTFWCSKWSILPPHFIALNLGASRQISGMRYAPSKDGDPDGNITRYEIHTSTDGTNWTLRASGTWTANGSDRDVAFSPVTGRYIKLTSTADRYGCASEVQAFCMLPTVVNPPPPTLTAQSLNAETNENVAVNITMSGTHSAGAALSYVILTQPTRGTLSGTAPNLTYTPIAGQSGADSFTYNANDGAYDSNTATVSITISPANIAPVAASQSVSTDEDKPLAIRQSATDANSDPLTYRILSQPSMGKLSGTAPNLTYTPNAHTNGSDSFTFRANDGKADSNIATVSITVVPVNDAPTAVAQITSTLEDSPVGILLSVSDRDGDTLSYRIVSNPAKGSISGTAPNLTYKPNANASGSDSFSFLANDGKADSNTATITITINPVNDAPVATAQVISATAGTPKGIVLSASDVDGDPLTFSIVGGPTKGSISGNPPNLTYTPNASASGSDSISFRVSDGKVNSNTATISINFTAAQQTNNKAPVFQADLITRASGKTNENYTADTLAGSAVDPDANVVSYSKTSGPVWLTVSPDGKISGTPPAGADGLNSFTIRASDPSGAFDEALLEITIQPHAELPLPWSLGKIGILSQDSTAWGDLVALKIKSSGSLGSSADSGIFTWQTLSGDGEIIARISMLENADSSSRIGLEIRSSLASNANHVFIGTDGSGSLFMVSRTKTGGSTSSIMVGSGQTPNLWLRLSRTGDFFNIFTSLNGISWKQVGKVTGRFGTSNYIGLMVSGRGNNLSTGTFEDVSVIP
jgi:hypothetical protein